VRSNRTRVLRFHDAINGKFQITRKILDTDFTDYTDFFTLCDLSSAAFGMLVIFEAQTNL